MKINELKDILNQNTEIAFELPDGTLVPSHFHVTEVGKVSKHFIDCGGKIRNEEVANLQLWNADDYDHRLHPEKMLKIVELSQEKLAIGNLDIEVEYQGETIGKYGLDFNGKHFILTNKFTDCLAKEECGVPAFDLSNMAASNSCTPGGGCC
ncbi:DUF6428 family protein [Portibacter lacus]|uniref:Uncharacterized protein n=1 Tax=Portibacter lacus TaxID=1099794 RepID=A0AA37SNP3_9BACT|nr:DUF6428 family protein [Portibacter lacus]GLR16960.1 hypothetical protein GCM10007940_15750 [Portibacter lacus]